MNVPLMPSDNFYKFGAFLCIALAISSMIGAVNLFETHINKTFERLNHSIELKDKLNENERKSYDNLVSSSIISSAKDRDFLGVILMVVSTFSMIGGAWFMAFWYKKEQKFNDQIKEFEFKIAKLKYNQDVRKVLGDNDETAGIS